MKKTICVFLSMILVLSSCRQSTSTWQEQYDLGMKYLSEGNYEEAIIAFTAAIEIDPKQAETYEKLADTYLALGDIELALAALRDGYAATGDVRLQARIDELTTPEPISESLYTLWSDLKLEEITFLGQSIQNLDIWTMDTIMEDNGLIVSEIDLGDKWSIVGGFGPQILVTQYKDDEYATLWSYHGGQDAIGVGMRGIHLNDTLETVWRKLGVLNAHEAAAYIEEIAAETYEDDTDISVMLGTITGSFHINGFYSEDGALSYMSMTMYIPAQNNEHYGRDEYATLWWSYGDQNAIVEMDFFCEPDGQFVLTKCLIKPLRSPTTLAE